MRVVSTLGSLIIPLMLVLIPLHGLMRRVKVMDAFVRGAEEGLRLVLRMTPYMIAMFAALASVRSSGLIEAIVGVLAAPLGGLGLTPEIIALGLLRPISGSGSLAIASDLMRTYGPDSFLGMLASTMQGSTDTTFYVVALYFGSVGVTRTRHTVACGLLGDLAGLLAATIICSSLFR